jgi:hypothetical protein
MNTRQYKGKVFGFGALGIRNRRKVNVEPNLRHSVSPRCWSRMRMTYIIWKIGQSGRNKVVGQVGSCISIDLAIVGIT